MERELPQAVITAEALADSQCARTRSNADLVRVEWEKIVWTARAEIPAQAAPAATTEKKEEDLTAMEQQWRR